MKKYLSVVEFHQTFHMNTLICDFSRGFQPILTCIQVLSVTHSCLKLLQILIFFVFLFCFHDMGISTGLPLSIFGYLFQMVHGQVSEGPMGEGRVSGRMGGISGVYFEAVGRS